MRFLRFFFTLCFFFGFSLIPPVFSAESISIISRASWGADESLRYGDNPLMQARYGEYLKYLQSPKTQDQLDAIADEANRKRQIQDAIGDAGKIVYRQYTEKGHPLYVPIEKTKQVSRIIVHHEGVVLNGSSTDEEIIRTIYKNHVQKGWGDIAYHYIIGQRGEIYEGRAGGDYTIGTHALSNNMGTVGIVILGNYTENVLNRDQLAGLKELIQYLAKKYGITLSQDALGFECPDSTCKILDVIRTKSLLGHRDVKNTNCPGDNVYPLISGWIKELSVQYTPILNLKKVYLEAIPKERTLNTTLVTPPTIITPNHEDYQVSIASSSSKVRYVGKKFKVKLAYPDTKSIALSFLEYESKKISLGNKKISVGTGENIAVGIVGNSKIEVTIGSKKYEGTELRIAGNVVRIDSWNRIPAWDTTRRYNDNLFRDTIVLRNDGGKLLVVNELPLEWYLRGLGEVSNGDMPEKIKTIIVAARSYAKYYMDPLNRKYKTKLYDGSDDPDSFQKYLGYGYESRSPNVTSQVVATKGLVITYDKKPIKPWYFSSSSGKTLSYLEYCNKSGKSDCADIPYLQSVDDPGSYGHTQSGHGVGISGAGATYWAGQGWGYQKIITYYLPGTKVEKK